MGERVVALMQAPNGRYAGRTLQEFADASREAAREVDGKDFSKPKLEAIRRGGVNTSLAIARTLAHMLDCSAAYLFGDTDDPAPDTLSATAIAKRLQDMPAREVERFFDQVAARLVDYRPQTSGREKDASLLSNVRAGRVSPDPDRMEAFWEGIPLFYKREEARMRGIVFTAASFGQGYREEETEKERRAGRSVSDEWLDAFRRYAPTAKDGKMAELWAGMLWYEFRYPGSIAVRTLMAVPAMSEAVFINLMKFSGALVRIEDANGQPSGEYFIRPNDDKGPNYYLKMFDLSYDDILELEEYGLVRLNHRDIILPSEMRLIYGSGPDTWGLVIKQETKMRVNALTEVSKDLRPLYKGKTIEDYFKGVRAGIRSTTTAYQRRT